MNKLVLNKSILEASKIVVYLKWKYGSKSKLCYMDAGSFIVYIKTEHINRDIAKDVETLFDTWNHFRNGKIKK